MRRVLVAPLTWSIVMLAGCAGNPTSHQAPSPPAPPSSPVAANLPPAPSAPVVAVPPKPAETGEAIVTKIVVSTRLDPAAANTPFPIYAEASLMGHGRVKLTAIWQYQTGAVMGRTTTMVTLDGSALASFKVEHPDPWPLGWYQLEVDVNDQKPNSAEHFMVTSQGLISEGFGPRSRFPRSKVHGNPH